MHELALAAEVLDLVTEAAAAERARPVRRVRNVRLLVGALAGVEPEALRFAWEAVREGSVAASAPLVLTAVAATGTCADCGDCSPAWDRLELCPACGSAQRQVSGGTELSVESVEVE